MLDKVLLLAFLLFLILCAIIDYSRDLLGSLYLAGQLKNLKDNKIREQEQLLDKLNRQHATTQTCAPNLNHAHVASMQIFTTGHIRRPYNGRTTQPSHFPANRQR